MSLNFGRKGTGMSSVVLPQRSVIDLLTAAQEAVVQAAEDRAVGAG